MVESQSYIYGKLFVNKLKNLLYSQDKSTPDIKNFSNIKFDQSISFKDIEFDYENGEKKIFDELNLIIKKNDKIGILGKSGSGKTTFLNLLMGLIEPTKGKIEIDNKNISQVKFEWQSMIGYVPQNVTILDETVKKNITFYDEEKKIDFNLLKEAIDIAGLNEFIKKNKDGLNTIIGEKGSKISGGEILRIGIARAYYSNPKIFIFDEFTSALDKLTENLILNSLDKIKKTMIIVSHKENTLKISDKIYKLDNKKLKVIDVL